MNKRLNTVVFVLVATLGNLLVMTILLVAGLFVLSRFHGPENPLQAGWIGVVFIVSIVGSLLIYTALAKRIIARFHLEEKLDPIFGSRKTQWGREKNNRFE